MEKLKLDLALDIQANKDAVLEWMSEYKEEAPAPTVLLAGRLPRLGLGARQPVDKPVAPTKLDTNAGRRLNSHLQKSKNKTDPQIMPTPHSFHGKPTATKEADSDDEADQRPSTISKRGSATRGDYLNQYLNRRNKKSKAK